LPRLFWGQEVAHLGDRGVRCAQGITHGAGQEQRAEPQGALEPLQLLHSRALELPLVVIEVDEREREMPLRDLEPVGRHCVRIVEREAALLHEDEGGNSLAGTWFRGVECQTALSAFISHHAAHGVGPPGHRDPKGPGVVKEDLRPYEHRSGLEQLTEEGDRHAWNAQKALLFPLSQHREEPVGLLAPVLLLCALKPGDLHVQKSPDLGRQGFKSQIHLQHPHGGLQGGNELLCCNLEEGGTNGRLDAGVSYEFSDVVDFDGVRGGVRHHVQ